MLDPNQVGTLAASVTGAGNGFAFRNDSTDLAIGTVAGLSGITTNNGEILLQTTTSGGISLNRAVNAGTATVTLNSAGTVSESNGAIITAGTLTGSSVGGASLNDANLLTNLGAFTNAGLGGFALTNGQTLAVTGAVDSGTGNLALTTTAGDLLISAGLTAGGTAALTAAGSMTISSPISSNAFSATASGGVINLNDGAATAVSTSGGGQNYNSPVVLQAATTVQDDGSGAITFASIADGAFSLTVNTAGTTTFGGAVGGTTALLSLTTDAPGTTAINGGAVTTTGNQAYGDPVMLGAGATTLTSTGSGDITFGQTVNGASALNVATAGTTNFGGAVGGTTALLSLRTDFSGTTAISGGAVTTTGAQTYDDPVTLGAAVTTLTSTGTGSITFGQLLNGASALTVNAPSTTAFLGPVGGTTALLSLTTDAPGLTAIRGSSVTTTGAQTYGDAVTLGTVPTTLTSTAAGNITFGQTVNGAAELSVNTAGTTTFSGRVGGATALQTLTTDAPGTTAINGGAVTTGGVQHYGDPVTLEATATTLTSTASGDVTFGQTVNGASALTILTAGAASFSGAVGGTTALASLAATGSTIILGADITATGALTLTSTGSGLPLNLPHNLTGQTMRLNSAGTISQTGGIITAGTLNGDSAGNAAFGQNNRIATLGAFGTGNGNLTLNDSIGLNINGPVTVGSGNMTLNVAGSITEGTNGRISASTLTVQSSGGTSLLATGVIGNRIATLGASTNTGSGGFALNNNSDLTVSGAINAGTGDLSLSLGSPNFILLSPPGKLTVNAALQAGRDISLRGGELLLAATATAERDLRLTTSLASGQGSVTISANQNAGGNLLGTTDGAMNLTGSFKLTAGNNVVLVSNGAFTQRGTLTVAAPDVVVDTTGRTGGASQLLSDLLAAQGGGTSITDASIIKGAQFAPHGSTHNAISFDTGTVNATNSVMLLLGDAGAMTGTVNVLGLGVSGQGGSADLHGSIAGNATQTAAQQGFINPQTQNNYQFNGCAIGSACVVMPIQPREVSQVDILLARPSEADILLARPSENDLDAPLINIFDEQLCERLRRTNPEAAREVCR